MTLIVTIEDNSQLYPYGECLHLLTFHDIINFPIVNLTMLQLGQEKVLALIV